VEKERRVSKTGRPQKEVLAMYQQAMQESGGKSNKTITIDGFLTVARQHNLGVPTPTSESLFLSTQLLSIALQSFTVLALLTDGICHWSGAGAFR
jgi:hypothetical protein